MYNIDTKYNVFLINFVDEYLISKDHPELNDKLIAWTKSTLVTSCNARILFNLYWKRLKPDIVTNESNKRIKLMFETLLILNILI